MINVKFKLINGEIETVLCSTGDSIEDIKLWVSFEEECRLIVDGCILEDTDTLWDDVDIQVLPALKPISPRFKIDRYKHKIPSEYYGLAVKVACCNNECESLNGTSYIPLGYGQHEMVKCWACPSCDNEVALQAIILSNCRYDYFGIVKGSEMQIKTDELIGKDVVIYENIDPGLDKWKRVLFIVHKSTVA